MGKRGRRRALLAGAALAAGMTAAVVGALAPAKATTVTTTPWKIANVWTTAHGGYLSVEATGPSDAWAVGTLYSGISDPVAPLLAHWNGKSWQTATIGAFKGYVSPYQVKATSPANVWVYASKQDASQVKLFHFDGAHWSTVSLQAGIQGGRDMVVLGPKDVWFAGLGSLSSSGKPQQDMWHWDGNAWVNHPIATSAGITGLTGISGSNLQAVGITWQAGGFTGPLSAFKWTGSRWVTMGIPATLGRYLPEITMDAANDAWIESATRDNSSVFALHWNGRSWSRIQAAAGLAVNPYPVATGNGGVWLGPSATGPGAPGLTPALCRRPPGRSSPTAARRSA